MASGAAYSQLVRVRGTKNPNLAAITGLVPDIVLANQEENRHIAVGRYPVLAAAGSPWPGR